MFFTCYYVVAFCFCLHMIGMMLSILGQCKLTDPRVWNSSRLLVKLPEHTWGLPSENDQGHWSNPAFYPLRKSMKFFILHFS